MTKTTVLIAAIGLAAGLQSVHSGDITGTITLKGTPPKEKDITILKEDPTCGKMHSEMPTHPFLSGWAPKPNWPTLSSPFRASAANQPAPRLPLWCSTRKAAFITPSIFAVQTGQKITVKNSDPVLHNVHTVPGEGSGNKDDNKAQLAGAPESDDDL